MIFKILFLTTFLLAFNTYSQSKLDQLQLIIENEETSDSVKKETYKQLITIDLLDSNIVNYYRNLAVLSSKEEDYLTSIEHSENALKYIPPAYEVKRLEVEEDIAKTYRKMGETDRSIEKYLSILSEYEKLGNLKESGRINNRIGTFFKILKEYDNAIYHLEESIAQSSKTNDTLTHASSLMTLGNCYKKLEDITNAEKCYMKSIQLAEESNNKRLLAGNYNNLGSLLRIKEEYNKAMLYYKKATIINEETNNKKWLSYNYNNIGVVYGKLGQNENALRYYHKSLALKKELKDERGKLQTYLSISEVYAEIGKYKDAYTFNLQGLKLSDSLDKVDRIQETMILAAEFQSEKREAKIVKLNMLDELNQEKIKSSEDRVKMLIGGIFMLSFLIFFIWKLSQSQKKTNKILESKNSQIRSKNKEITDSIDYAKRFQLSILPSESEMNNHFKNQAVLYQPKDIVSGDFYKFYAHSKDTFHVATADCTGHGVPGAMVSLIASSFITKAIKEERIESPSEILNFINSEMPKAFESDEILINDGMDISLVKIDKKNQMLTFSGANNNCWIINTSESFENRSVIENKHKVFNYNELSILELKGNRFGIGLTSSASHFTQTTIPLVENDRIILFTDGIVDQFGGSKNKKFKAIQLREIFFSNQHLSPEELKIRLTATLKKWMENTEQIDDICVFIADI